MIVHIYDRYADIGAKMTARNRSEAVPPPEGIASAYGNRVGRDFQSWGYDLSRTQTTVAICMPKTPMPLRSK
jgi:hypothetical protein